MKKFTLLSLLITLATITWARTIYVYPKAWESNMEGNYLASYRWQPSEAFDVMTADPQHEGLYLLEVPDGTAIVIPLLVPNGLTASWDNNIYQTINCNIEGDEDDILLVITEESGSYASGKPIFRVERTTLSEYSKSATNYSVDLTPEFKETVYAGCPNYFTLKVENITNAARTNVHASVFNDGVLIWEETIDNIIVGETKVVDVIDWTIRPVAENTVIGNNNASTLYKVVVEDADGSTESEYPFTVLYNGNLGKDYAYTTSAPLSRTYSFNGDVLILGAEGFSASNATSRDDAFAVYLNGGSVHKALLYVPYNWDKASDGDFNSWTTSFNGTPIAPLAHYRDQSNLGNYGSYGYGLVIYDVTDAVADGDNTFAIQKTEGISSVYPSTLIVMVENPSGEPKNVYFVEDADLLSRQNNKKVDAIYASSFQGVAAGESALLYVFAAGAQAGEGDLIINEATYSDVFMGTSQSVEVVKVPVESGDVAVQLKATGSSILAIQQMLVISGDDPAGIVSMEDGSSMMEDEWYDLQGRKLEGKPTQPGVYIYKGKKVMVKG